MKREDFIEQFQEVEKSGDWERRPYHEYRDLVLKHVDLLKRKDVPPGYQELVIGIEELAELAQQVAKALRGKPDKIHILEELADVHLVIHYIEVVLGISNRDVDIALEVKTRKLERLIKEVSDEIDRVGKDNVELKGEWL